MAQPNIYTMVVFDLHPKIAEYIEALNADGQIDLDDAGYPYLLNVQQEGSNHVCNIVRNGQQENFVMNTRKRRDPIKSWNESDGYKRTGGKKVIQVTTDGEPDRRERARRPFESFERLTTQILEG